MATSEEFGYFSKDVAERVGVGADTLRSWSLRLEAEGIAFERNNRKQRIYYERDILAIEELKKLVDAGHLLNDASKMVAEKMKNGEYLVPQGNHATITPSVSHENHATVTPEERIHQQLQQFKKEIVAETTTAMQDRFESAIQEAVRLALLQERKAIAAEVAREIAAATEKEKAEEAEERAKEKEKKSFWQRLFQR